MPKINVYLPDELADAVRATGLSVSPICQRALEHAVRQANAIQAAVTQDLDGGEPALARFTDRARSAVRLAIEQAREAGEPNVSTARLLAGLLAEGGNLALQVLGALEIAPEQLTAALAGAPSAEPEQGPDSALRFSGPAARALELTVAEVGMLGHNYVGCEHLLLGLVAEPGGAGGEVLRAAGAEPKLTRRAVAAALVGYNYLRASQGTTPPSAGQLTSLLQQQLQQQLQPLVARIESLEARLGD
ncbi:ATP-dependent Clp protease ATP-binding subunit [Kitasatospora acidiphila]|uniref:ATP-dependent Clp protease ATP-binding subunit n=1 Tax=Kitasatospora acidiphila TaxID=2567942 RepID=A0A540VZD8_9ACTN|nr:Clp protease N-terminal domain-containing protein [Kitasatospora acidiphila]TQF01464.1 ATP-dependent Clp protease ATP-binding subunit [Kitasatospora acidiphila]